ncbi:MAG: M1 family metallopeptidase [Acidobacteriota bacterium]|nr:M1 family metallopeptidase [Blastocatellia bacterium]MDW8412939.1 M1 family metallopeptidase [Acidobacteriota bacterium]
MLVLMFFLAVTIGAKDVHSYANSDRMRVKHLVLDLEVLFDRKVLRGFATLEIERVGSGDRLLKLDTRELKIERVEISKDGKLFRQTEYKLGAPDKILGSELSVSVDRNTRYVRISYETSPSATALQWLEPEQTAGKKYPFLFTQSQAIHARSWIPLQDSPAVRVTYSAHIKTPRELLAVMSAKNVLPPVRSGEYSFEMELPIAPYLIALAVGDIAFKPLGPRTGVYAEASVVDRAAKEFEDVEQMMKAVEKLYGEYRWGRYDILVLPPSFPFGGMENPRLTFVTPSLLAGDKSLVSTVAHELAHSWSGNLVTNATWSDFWLNEGFTTYLTYRIQEEVYGKQRTEMEAVLGRRGLEKTLEEFEDKDEILNIDLRGRDPDDGMNDIPYEKGALFLRHLEEVFGRETFDNFLKSYFNHFAFKSITTADFEAYLKANLLDKYPELAAKVPVAEWIHAPGLPKSAPLVTARAFAEVEQQADKWLRGCVSAAEMRTSSWSHAEWMHFLNYLPADLDAKRMAELDEAFRLTSSGNQILLSQWLVMSVRSNYTQGMQRLESYLGSIGRRLLILPIYNELVKADKAMAIGIYKKVRATYHPVAQATLDKLLGFTPDFGGKDAN